MPVVINEFEALAVEPPPAPAEAAVPPRGLDPEAVRVLIRRDEERRERVLAD